MPLLVLAGRSSLCSRTHNSFYKRLIAAVPLKNVTSRFAMERLKGTTAYPLQAAAFRDRRAPEPDA